MRPSLSPPKGLTGFIHSRPPKILYVLPSSSFAIGNAGTEEAVRVCLGSPNSREKVEVGLNILARVLGETRKSPAQII